ncbi:hypothetical protein [Flavobacterium nitrogenifigens]|nr:hypothetical protein [Flavobacterium nitrogenifigens]
MVSIETDLKAIFDAVPLTANR